jgi:hypothetical protein
LIQIPYESELISAGNMTITDAGDLVDNIKGIWNSELFYYSIGNEWDRYTVSSNKYYSSEIATKIMAYALEMKKRDPNILIVAPSLSSFWATEKQCEYYPKAYWRPWQYCSF